MPYKSDAQRRYFNANRAKLEAEGVDVDEYNQASKGKKLGVSKLAKQAASVFVNDDEYTRCRGDFDKEAFASAAMKLAPAIGGAVRKSLPGIGRTTTNAVQGATNAVRGAANTGTNAIKNLASRSANATTRAASTGIGKVTGTAQNLANNVNQRLIASDAGGNRAVGLVKQVAGRNPEQAFRPVRDTALAAWNPRMPMTGQTASKNLRLPAKTIAAGTAAYGVGSKVNNHLQNMPVTGNPAIDSIIGDDARVRYNKAMMSNVPNLLWAARPTNPNNIDRTLASTGLQYAGSNLYRNVRESLSDMQPRFPTGANVASSLGLRTLGNALPRPDNNWQPYVKDVVNQLQSGGFTMDDLKGSAVGSMIKDMGSALLPQEQGELRGMAGRTGDEFEAFFRRQMMPKEGSVAELAKQAADVSLGDVLDFYRKCRLAGM